MDRRLTTVLAADVVGYSRLMRHDEEGTLTRLIDLRQTIGELTVAHGGRTFGAAGDSMLAEFQSPVEAVRCAFKLQRALQKTNIKIESEKRMHLRIGVNLGDVMHEDGNLYGDGINVAARLEGVSDAGGICLSANVHEQVRDKIEITFEDYGEQTFKNIDRPIRVWKWSPIAEIQIPENTTTRAIDKPSIAILPFENMSSDPEDEYFAHGIADDIATDLSRISGLVVIARSATRDYKDRSVSSGQVARELGVRYILDGSVRRGGGRVRVNARLMDAEKSSQLWADRFDGELDEVFDLQDQITESTVTTLAVTLTRAEQDRSFRKETKSLQAYDFVLQGNAYHYHFTKEDNEKAIAAYIRAIELDPDYAPAHAGYAWALMHDSNQDWGDDPKASVELAMLHAKQAVRLDSGLAKAHMALADYYCWTRQNNLAVIEGRRAVELDPSNAELHFALAYYLVTAGEPHEAVEEAKLSIQYNPMYANCNFYETLGISLYLSKQYEAACAALEEGVGRHPNYDGLHQWLTATYAQLEQIDDAKRHAEEYRKLRPGVSLEKLAKRLPYKRKSDLDHMIDGLRKAGIPENTRD